MPSRCIPRAIAPLVTTTTSTPSRCRAATSSTIRAITDRRSSPDSSATIDEPSLTTATGMTPRTLGGVELEHHATELDVVARFEPLRLERGDHAHAPEAVLDVRERLVVREVVACDQAVDGVAGDAEPVRPGALDLERTAGGRAEDLELGDVVLARVLGPRVGDGDATQQLAPQLVEPLADRRRRDDDRNAEALAPFGGGSVGELGRHEVGLRQREDARELGEAGVVLAQLRLDHRVVGGRVRAVERREVEHVDEQPRALDVGEEVVAETGAGAGALDQPRDVGDHELAVVGVECAEDRLQRGERVGGDLRLSAREAREQRRLAGVRQPDEADVGEQLEMQLDAPLLPRQPLLGQPRRLPCRALEAGVAAAARAAAGDRDLLAGADEVVARAVPALDLGARRHRDDQRVAVRSVHLLAEPVAAALGAEVRSSPERLQVAQRVVAAQDDIAAAAAVAAVGAALGDVRLAAERQRAVAAGAGSDLQVGAIREHSRRYGTTMPQVFLITGASTGIGAATARQAAQAGYQVVLAARSEDKLQALASETGGLAVRCDVTEWSDQEALVKRALDEFGQIDVVFANAGVGGARGFLKEDPETWKRMILTNVYGCALTIRATMPALKESKGHLLLTSSVAGRRALPGSVYSVSKHAVTAMGEAARLDYNDTGVRVTLIEPGAVDTPFFDNPPKIRALEAGDVARAIMFAVSQPPHVDVNEILIRPTTQPT